jgi:hypothetical protein
LLESLKRTNIRFVAGLKATLPLPWTKIPNVGVALASIVVVTLLAGGAKQAPVVGLVWQRERFTGRVAPPVSADAVIFPLAPTFTVATANTPVPGAPGMLTIPSPPLETPFMVAANATMSGIGVADAKNSSVFSPEMIAAELALDQLKLNCTSVNVIGALGLSETMKQSHVPSRAIDCQMVPARNVLAKQNRPRCQALFMNR